LFSTSGEVEEGVEPAPITQCDPYEDASANTIRVTGNIPNDPFYISPNVNTLSHTNCLIQIANQVIASDPAESQFLAGAVSSDLMSAYNYLRQTRQYAFGVSFNPTH
jgi:UDP-N-acetyl-D-mannosaminuronate dehydrogenase